MGIRGLLLTLVLAVALAVAATSLAGGISDEPCPNIAGENTNTCPPGQLGALYSIKFLERGGSGCGPGRQTFHLDSGELPPGLTLAADGTLSGIPVDTGTSRFYVEMREPQDDPAHCAGKRTQKEFTLKICRQPGMVSSQVGPPRAEVRVPLRMTLLWCGGVGALTWTRSGLLPAGVTLRADGSIAGVPRAAGTYRFVVTATDVRSRVARFGGTISVAPSIRIRTPRLPPAKVGRLYRVELAETGGITPSTWTVARGRLPRGIRLDKARGVLIGKAERAGTHRITVEVRDGLSMKAAKVFTLVVRG